MSSIISGYEYDIFISYRHNDNRSGWVAEFVNALEEELASTIKEPPSIYFDKNLHDGLLETYNVDKSLEGKLKCLVFIPIISQTYCDPKSFAWQHEFCEFNNLAKRDTLGRDIKLSNGNVASRILPVKIHELDTEDTAVIETEIGGALRAIEFIYKEPGVNRPLKVTDRKDDNQNHTDYDNQVNKVANGIKEIITAIKNPYIQNSRTAVQEKTKLSIGRKSFIGTVLLLLIIFLCYFAYQQLTIRNELPTLNKSIAVLPFVDMSPSKDQEYLSNGIAEEIITSLSQLKELKVIGRTSSFQFKGKNIDLREIGNKLNVSSVLEGSVMKSGNKLRITAQLINVEDGSHIWSERYEREMEDVFAIMDDIGKAIFTKMKVSMINSTVTASNQAVNIQAYENYLKGQLTNGVGLGDKAKPFFEKAIQLDPDYTDAYLGLAESYFYSLQALKHADTVFYLTEKVLSTVPTSARAHGLLYNYYMFLNWNWAKAKQQYEVCLSLTGYPPIAHPWFVTMTMGDVKQGIAELKIIMEHNPLDKDAISMLGYFMGIDGQFETGQELLKKAIEIDPSYPVTYSRFAQICTIKGDFELALENYDKAESLGRQSADERIWTLVKMGHMKKAMELFSSLDLTKWDPFLIASMQFSLGKPDDGFKWLEQSIRDDQSTFRSRVMLHVFDEVREDVRFKALVDKMDIPKSYH